MDKILIAGVDTVVGANLAVTLQDRYEIVGLSLSTPITICGSETSLCSSRDVAAIRDCVAQERPNWLVYCGPAAQSSWNGGGAPVMQLIRTPELARPWAEAAAACDCEFTLISSDAVFNGPWLFHDENDTCYSAAPAAQAIRAMEREVSEICQRTLIVRTNAYGWSPISSEPGLVETVLEQSSRGESCVPDYDRNATPILATDLAEMLEQAYLQRLTGLLHFGGAERVSPYRFGTLLARRFGFGHLADPEAASLPDGSREFGAGDTSLQCRKVRECLGITVPLLREGLDRLYAQANNGFRDQFRPERPILQDMVA